MKYIRIKVKHILLLAVIGFVLFFSSLFLKGYIFYGLGKINEGRGDTSSADVYYNRAANEFPGSLSSVYAAKSRLELMIKEKNLGYFKKVNVFGSSSSCDGAFVSPYSIDEINLQYGEISAAAERDDTFAEYSMDVAVMNYFAGSNDRALDLLEGIDYIKDESLEELRKLHLAAMHMSLGEIGRGMDIIRDDLGNKDGYSIIRDDLAKYYYFMVQDFESFKGINTDDAARYKNYNALKSVLVKPFEDIQNIFSGYAEIAEKNFNLPESGNSLSGRVTLDGKPAAYVIVYLKENALKNEWSSNFGMNLGIRKVAVTDEDGCFNMDNVPDGLYGVGVNIDWNRVNGRTASMNKEFDIKFGGNDRRTENIDFIDTADMINATALEDNKIKFDINPPAKAAYYRIQMGEVRKNEENETVVNYAYSSGKIEGSTFIMDVEKERRNSVREGFSYGSDGIDPYNIMDPLYHTGEYTYTLYAYDGNGNILYDSSGLYPGRKFDTVAVGGSEWTEADRLLLNKKFEEAIGKYEECVDADPGDLHSAKMLAGLYFNGWKYNKDSYRLEGGDPAKAGKYYGILYEKVPESSSVKSCLAYIYTDLEEYEKALGLFMQLSEDNGYVNYQIARIYGYMGKFDEEAGYLKRYNESTGNGADYLLMVYILQNKEDLIYDTALRYDNKSYYAEYGRLASEYLKMDRSRYAEFFRLIERDEPESAAKLIENEDDDLARLYEGILVLQKHVSDSKAKEEVYNGIYEKVKDRNISELMKLFGKAALNTGFGD